MATKKEYTWGVLSAPTNNSVDIEAELGQSIYVELKNAQYLTGCPVEVSANADNASIGYRIFSDYIG